MTTEVIATRRTDTVTSPVTEGQNQTVQLGVIGVNAAAFAHRHMMRRIETGRTDISPRSGKAGFTINGIPVSYTHLDLRKVFQYHIPFREMPVFLVSIDLLPDHTPLDYQHR